MRFLFFCAHPDDLEFYISNIMISIAKKKDTIIKVISMTKGEYGSLTPELMGSSTLGRIREQELIRAAEVEGITNVEFIGCIDAHLEINQDVIQKVSNTISVFKPDVIFAPEGLYSYYPHDDHIRTGLIIYKIIKKMKKEERPTLFMYHSYVNTHYFPMKHWRQQSKALKQHISQYWLLLPMYPLRFLLGFYFGLRLSPKFRSYIMAEAVRKVDFIVDKRRKLGFIQRIAKLISSKVKGMFNPSKND